MYDKIVMHQANETVVNNRILPKLLSGEELIKAQKVKSCFIGQSKNLRFDKINGKIRVSGSLSKYFCGNNSVNLSFLQIGQAIKQLKIDFGFTGNESVSYLEFGFNCSMSLPIYMYLSELKYANGYSGKLTHGNKEVCFLQDEKVLRFYDKTDHFLQSQYTNSYNDKCINILRYEIIIKNIKRILKLDAPITMDMLFNENIVNSLVKLWLNEFGRVKVETSIRYTFAKFDFLKVKQNLILLGLKSNGGLVSFLKYIDSVEPINISKQNRKRVKDMAINLSEDDLVSRYNFVQEDLFSTFQLVAFANWVK